MDVFEAETELEEDKEFILSDNFEDFGFTTTDMIQNLSIIFLILLLLLAAPLCFLLLYGLFGWCRGCKWCLAAIIGAIFMNTYIRFFLESYLELCLSCMLRLEMLIFGAASTSFHSSLSIVLLALLFIFPAFTGTYMMCRKDKVGSEWFQKRFGELVLGLKIKERTALLHPVLFMVRRLVYAGILVSWLHRNIF